MSAQSGLINDWSAGEISEKMWGKFGHPVHDRGCQVLENFHVTEQSILTKRPGSEYQGTCYGSTNPARIVGYTYSETEAYIIEMTNGYIRLWRNGAVVAATATNVPWATAELDDIQIAQDTNGVFFAHENWAPVALVRTAQDTFAMGSIVFTYNTGAAYTSAASGNVEGDETLDVQETISSIPQQASFLVEHSPGRYDAYYFTSYATSTFSGVAPALIRSYDGGDTVLIGHKYHSNGAVVPFGATNNYPSAVGIVNGRVTFGGAENDPQRMWMAKAWGYEISSGSLIVQLSMYADYVSTAEELTDASTWSDPNTAETETVKRVSRITVASDAIDLVVGSDRAERILTMASAKHLIVGTTSSEWIIPGNITALQPYVEKPMTRYGCSRVQPTVAGSAAILTSRNKKRIRAYPVVGADNARPAELTRYADQITGTSGIKQLELVKDPFMQIQAVRSDGQLAVCTYDLDAGVVAWARDVAPSGWTITSAAVIEESTEARLYLVMHDGTNYYLVRRKFHWPTAQSDAVFFDCAYDCTTDNLVLMSGNTLTAAWLADETVSVLADGVYSGDETADGVGAIDLSAYSGASQLWVGLKYTAKYRSVASRAQFPAGTAENMIKRVLGLEVRVYRTRELVAGFNTYTSADMDSHSFSGTAWYSGIIEVEFNGDYDKEACINIISEDPVPCTITAITPILTTAEVAI